MFKLFLTNFQNLKYCLETFHCYNYLWHHVTILVVFDKLKLYYVCRHSAFSLQIVLNTCTIAN